MLRFDDVPDTRALSGSTIAVVFEIGDFSSVPDSPFTIFWAGH